MESGGKELGLPVPRVSVRADRSGVVGARGKGTGAPLIHSSTLPLAFLASLALGQSARAQVDQQRAQEWFKEAQAVCERDGGRLWGVKICGPMVIADRRTQTIATSQPAPDRKSTRPNSSHEW